MAEILSVRGEMYIWLCSQMHGGVGPRYVWVPLDVCCFVVSASEKGLRVHHSARRCHTGCVCV